MASEFLRGHILTEPPTARSPQPAAAVLLAEIQALLVELLHESKRQNDLLAKQAEMDRQAALKLDKISLQVHVIAVQVGRLVEQRP